MNTDTKERTMNATDIINALSNFDLNVDWENTGGGVYNVVAVVMEHPTSDIAYIGISDNGEWTEGDEDAEIDGRVSVVLYDSLTGDPIDIHAWAPDAATDPQDEAGYAATVDEVCALTVRAATWVLEANGTPRNVVEGI